MRVKIIDSKKFTMFLFPGFIWGFTKEMCLISYEDRDYLKPGIIQKSKNSIESPISVKRLPFFTTETQSLHRDFYESSALNERASIYLNRSCSGGRTNSLAEATRDSYGKPRTRATGTASLLPITSSVAEAISSATAIIVTRSNCP